MLKKKEMHFVASSVITGLVCLLSFQNTKLENPVVDNPELPISKQSYLKINLADVILLKRFPGSLIVDIRPNSAYQLNHIPGAVNITLEQLNTPSSQLLQRLKSSPNIIIYAQTHIQSDEIDRFIDRLEHCNLKNIKVYLQGYNEWRMCGLQLEETVNE